MNGESNVSYLTRYMSSRVLSNFQHIQLSALNGFPDAGQSGDVRVRRRQVLEEALHLHVIMVAEVVYRQTVDWVTSGPDMD